MNMRRPAMIAIVELHATTPGHGLRKPQFNSNANLQSERPVFRLTHRSIKHRHQQPAPQRPRWRRLRVAGEATSDAVTPSAAALGTRRSWRDFTRKPSNHRLAGYRCRLRHDRQRRQPDWSIAPRSRSRLLHGLSAAYLGV